MKWLRCLLGIHNLSNTNFSYGFGQLDLFCSRCEKRVLSLAVGRMPFMPPPPDEKETP